MKNKKAIIVLNYNTEGDTIECVDSVIKNTKYDSLSTIYIVDNGSNIETKEKLYNYCLDKQIKFIESNKNLGCNGGFNLGIKQALDDEVEYIFLLNSDIILENDAIEIMSNALSVNGDVAAVGTAVYDLKGNYTQYAKKPLTTTQYFLSTKAFKWLKVFIKGKNLNYLYDKTKDFKFDGLFCGCIIGLKKAFIKEIGKLDDRIFLYYEEDALSHQLVELGKKSYICANAKIIHKESVTAKKINQQKLHFARIQYRASALYVLTKYANMGRNLCKIIVCVTIIAWKIKSVFDKSYNNAIADFKKEINRLFENKIWRIK